MKAVCLLVLPVVLFGCAHVISESMRSRIDPNMPQDLLFNDPDAFKGQMVILGGIIVTSRNMREGGTYIEIRHKPLDSRGKPKYTGASLGRFLVYHKSYLDIEIYTRGREVTVAGEVRGVGTRPFGDVHSPYLLIEGRELHLFGMPWKEREGFFFDPYESF